MQRRKREAGEEGQCRRLCGGAKRGRFEGPELGMRSRGGLRTRPRDGLGEARGGLGVGEEERRRGGRMV